MHMGWIEMIVIVVVVLVATGAIGARRGQSSSGRSVPTRRPDGTLVLCRIPQRGAFGGVCAGFAYFFSWPVWVARLLWMVGIFVGGVGVLLYVLFWIFMPVAESLPEDFDARTT